jgi:hypothetical protein
MNHVVLISPCNRVLSKDKWTDYSIMHKSTPNVKFWYSSNMFTNDVRIFRTPYPNVMAVYMSRHIESGFISEHHPLQVLIVLFDGWSLNIV